MAKTGTVKFYNKAKGFGFIRQDDGSEDLFAHKAHFVDVQKLMEGGEVQYDKAYDEIKGKFHAENITADAGGERGGKGKKGNGGKKSSQPCMLWEQGTCKSDRCPFSHDRIPYR
jgi:CspA family cold shock protein